MEVVEVGGGWGVVKATGSCVFVNRRMELNILLAARRGLLSVASAVAVGREVGLNTDTDTCPCTCPQTRNLERVRVRRIKNRDVRIRSRCALRKIWEEGAQRSAVG